MEPRLGLWRDPWSVAIRALASLLMLSCGGRAADAGAAPGPDPTLLTELRGVPHRIVYETLRDGNWELFVVNADGSDPGNLTRSPDCDELYPHVSPDGARICFSADEGQGAERTRNVYWMNRDGSGRTLVARNARQACWRADGGAIAYLKGEGARFSFVDYATTGIVVYDLATGEHRAHPNASLHHLYNLCWSPDGTWFLATVHAGMGFRHAILAIAAGGNAVRDLGIGGCRPDLSADGALVAWGPSDWVLRAAEIDFSGAAPVVSHPRDLVQSVKPTKIYHADWSPDGRYVAFSRGPSTPHLGHAPEIVGIKANGWDICVADARSPNRWVQITTDGNCNKEPDWMPAPTAP